MDLSTGPLMVLRRLEMDQKVGSGALGLDGVTMFLKLGKWCLV